MVHQAVEDNMTKGTEESPVGNGKFRNWFGMHQPRLLEVRDFLAPLRQQTGAYAGRDQHNDRSHDQRA